MLYKAQGFFVFFYWYFPPIKDPKENSHVPPDELVISGKVREILPR
jgi:hypothetical protein